MEQQPAPHSRVGAVFPLLAHVECQKKLESKWEGQEASVVGTNSHSHYLVED